MAKETKQERLVRSMYDQTSEHLYDIKNLSSNPNAKELDVERWCQSVLKNCLGYTATSGYSITAQEIRGKMKPDLIVSKNGKPIFVLEIKKLGYDLNKSDLRSGKVQLSEYLHMMGDVKWGMLCNGFEWKLFDFSNQSIGGIEVISLDLSASEEDGLDLSKKGIEEVCWDLSDFHEHTFSTEMWSDFSKEATAFSPESLAKAILNIDVVKVIAKEIRGEYEYKANAEVLIDKVFSLVENGLTKASGWNDVKHLEIHKFVKAQKRAGRRRKKAGRTKDLTSQKPGEIIPTEASIAGAAEKSVENVVNKVAG